MTRYLPIGQLQPLPPPPKGHEMAPNPQGTPSIEEDATELPLPHPFERIGETLTSVLKEKDQEKRLLLFERLRELMFRYPISMFPQFVRELIAPPLMKILERAKFNAPDALMYLKVLEECSFRGALATDWQVSNVLDQSMIWMKPLHILQELAHVYHNTEALFTTMNMYKRHELENKMKRDFTKVVLEQLNTIPKNAEEQDFQDKTFVTMNFIGEETHNRHEMLLKDVMRIITTKFRKWIAQMTDTTLDMSSLVASFHSYATPSKITTDQVEPIPYVSPFCLGCLLTFFRTGYEETVQDMKLMTKYLDITPLLAQALGVDPEIAIRKRREEEEAQAEKIDAEAEAAEEEERQELVEVETERRTLALKEIADLRALMERQLNEREEKEKAERDKKHEEMMERRKIEDEIIAKKREEAAKSKGFMAKLFGGKKDKDKYKEEDEKLQREREEEDEEEAKEEEAAKERREKRVKVMEKKIGEAEAEEALRVEKYNQKMKKWEEKRKQRLDKARKRDEMIAERRRKAEKKKRKEEKMQEEGKMSHGKPEKKKKNVKKMKRKSRFLKIPGIDKRFLRQKDEWMKIRCLHTLKLMSMLPHPGFLTYPGFLDRLKEMLTESVMETRLVASSDDDEDEDDDEKEKDSDEESDGELYKYRPNTILPKPKKTGSEDEDSPKVVLPFQAHPVMQPESASASASVSASSSSASSSSSSSSVPPSGFPLSSCFPSSSPHHSNSSVSTLPYILPNQLPSTGFVQIGVINLFHTIINQKLPPLPQTEREKQMERPADREKREAGEQDVLILLSNHVISAVAHTICDLSKWRNMELEMVMEKAVILINGVWSKEGFFRWLVLTELEEEGFDDSFYAMLHSNNKGARGYLGEICCFDLLYRRKFT
ncbi:uncharacterized protein MONOS_10822 [Monocercomonoides exilis]|uniref:uncharacterized protein n=1 Tax=Monocercomonoides exilis TaxID=2049356 RepID=UPI00355A4ADA|nr:hypothetical protein MONOS_10822 [Monocercomonoides exilis]|eukprot:MONOS_10822.1-p1 / transcript=MONOS_10822.1 / gene=MONOS_10822 / organism=Monocercomonoides_exilis_PA203 / gene_product=unspecified product / transcript_product=unspecified product / location=Mono_scaffold00507:42256-45072(+) / protein_length=887 / sequence_SO=supercontig / SO=protein_coding / is_pseudo=false